MLNGYDKGLPDEQTTGLEEMDILKLRRVYGCNMDVEILDLTTRAYNSLKRSKIGTIGELARRYEEIGRIRGCGKNTIEEINERLQEFIEHYAPEPEQQAATGPMVRRQPIRHCIIMLGNIPKFLTCFGGSCLDMCRAEKIMSLDCVEYSLGQYSVKVPYEGRPRLYVNGEAMPAVMSRL